MHKVVEHHTLRVDVVEKEVGTLCKLKDDEGYGCGERGTRQKGYRAPKGCNTSS